jgi:hypothetical protein
MGHGVGTQCTPISDFEREVIKALAELTTDMKTIVGNGQPGRLDYVEKDIKLLSRTQNRIIGALVFLSVVLAPAVALAAAYLSRK